MAEQDPAERHVYSDRVCSAEETANRVMPVLEEHGVTRLARLTGLDRIGIPVWNAIRPNSRSLSVHQGKGITDIDAKVSAMMEAVERSCAEVPRLSTRWADRASLAASGNVFDTLNALIAKGRVLPGDDRPLEWAPGRDLVGGGEIWVPLDAVRLDRTQPSDYWQSSDGLSSGNTEQEAVFHGLLERIERDAEILWKFRPAADRARDHVDPHAFGDPVLSGLASRIAAAGFDLQLIDMTGDIGVPVFSAVLAPDEARRSGHRYIDVTTGSGAHPSPYRAAIRAVTEAVQSRLTLISGTRDDVAPSAYFDSSPVGLASSDKRSFRPPPAPFGIDAVSVSGMLRQIVDRLKACNIRRIVVVRFNPDETRFAVVKVLVPDLENPDGERQRRFGARAMARMLVFR